MRGRGSHGDFHTHSLSPSFLSSFLPPLSALFPLPLSSSLLTIKLFLITFFLLLHPSSTFLLFCHCSFFSFFIHSYIILFPYIYFFIYLLIYLFIYYYCLFLGVLLPVPFSISSLILFLSLLFSLSSYLIFPF